MYKGGCLCGAVKYEINGGIRNIVCCHCSVCRRVQGSAFATNGIVNLSEFSLVSGENNLTSYESSPGQSKLFCKTCGSPIYSKNETRPDQVRIRIGTIESDIEEKPEAHIFIGSKANWEEVCGDLPQFDSYEPDR